MPGSAHRHSALSRASWTTSWRRTPKPCRSHSGEMTQNVFQAATNLHGEAVEPIPQDQDATDGPGALVPCARESRISRSAARTAVSRTTRCGEAGVVGPGGGPSAAPKRSTGSAVLSEPGRVEFCGCQLAPLPLTRLPPVSYTHLR